MAGFFFSRTANGKDQEEGQETRTGEDALLMRREFLDPHLAYCKPKIALAQGCGGWVCISKLIESDGGFSVRRGIGENPVEAYQNWKHPTEVRTVLI